MKTFNKNRISVVFVAKNLSPILSFSSADRKTIGKESRRINRQRDKVCQQFPFCPGSSSITCSALSFLQFESSLVKTRRNLTSICTHPSHPLCRASNKVGHVPRNRRVSVPPGSTRDQPERLYKWIPFVGQIFFHTSPITLSELGKADEFYHGTRKWRRSMGG